MKIIHASCAIHEIQPQQMKQLEQGQWHHWNRLLVLKTSGRYAVVSMNFFERFFRSLLHVFHINYFHQWGDKKIALVSLEELSREKQELALKSQDATAKIFQSPSQPSLAPLAETKESKAMEERIQASKIEIVATISPQETKEVNAYGLLTTFRDFQVRTYHRDLGDYLAKQPLDLGAFKEYVNPKICLRVLEKFCLGKTCADGEISENDIREYVAIFFDPVLSESTLNRVFPPKS